MIYREKYPEIRKCILEECSPPREEILKRLNKDMDKYNLKGTREAGKAVNMLVDSMLLLSIQKLKVFPKYPLLENIDQLLEKNVLTTEETDQVEMIKDQYQTIYYAKKKNADNEIPLDEGLVNLIRQIMENEANYLATGEYKKKVLTQKRLQELWSKNVGL